MLEKWNLCSCGSLFISIRNRIFGESWHNRGYVFWRNTWRISIQQPRNPKTLPEKILLLWCHATTNSVNLYVCKLIIHDTYNFVYRFLYYSSAAAGPYKWWKTSLEQLMQWQNSVEQKVVVDLVPKESISGSNAFHLGWYN